ncbi:spore coat protein YsxE [Bacillus thermophilus]|uniref:Spore coat protein YsxE n=1 Tax=Siminovitchia thermophila TaxID=1245522 RepID=A0ABS2R248_9BACI|nr:spore coat protein YsxE [Siminovitchia thermophila]MBM7713465.1 spore coat protein YsxE [Siminovitchia thermophila]
MDDPVKSLKEIAGLYGLNLKFAERFGRVYKIYTDKGEFALKRINANRGIDFLKYVQLLYQRGYYRIVPIYPALDGRYAVLSGNSLYYLMPWLENREREGQFKKNQELFRELARLHTISAREVEVSPDDRKEHYEQTLSRWEKEKEGLEQFVERSEKPWYMSPFQLLFCSYYHEIALAQRYAIGKLKEWYEVTEDEKKARSVIIHGKLSPEHFLYHESGFGYFTNFEKAGTASPIHDLLPFLARTMETYPKAFDECIDWLHIYFKYFPFRKEEMLLFLGYLAQPGKMYQTVENYYSAGKEKHELRCVQGLQRQYWYMKNTEYIVMRLEEYERQMQDPPSES